MPEANQNQIFTDMLVAVPTVLDSQEDGKLRARFKATQANVVNTNTRLYPFNVLNDGVEESQTLVTENRMIGESPHPKHFVAKDGKVAFDTRLENSVIKIIKHFMDDGTVYVDAEVLDTALGKDLKALIDAGVPVGISMRALGDSVKKQIGGAMVDVATKLQILSYDVVMNPATPGCEVVEVLTDSQVAAVLADDVQITIPACPGCGALLTPQDPDDDGDLDFYSCVACKEVYLPEENKTVEIYASQRLRKLPNDPDYDGYFLAKQFKMAMGAVAEITETVKDNINQGDDDEMALTKEELLKMMQDSPEIQDLIKSQAEAIAKPALDAVNAQSAAAEAAKVAETTKEETKAFVDGKIGELKGKMADEVIAAITDSIKDVTNKEAAGAIIDSVIDIYSKASSKLKLDGLGFNNTSGEGGALRTIEVGHEPKPWGQAVQKILDSFDIAGKENGHMPHLDIRKVNQPDLAKMIDKLEKQVGYEALKDSAAFMDSAAMEDAISVTTNQLLNQPTIQQAIIIQAFQEVESLQFLATETFAGDEVRWPVETFTSAGAIDPATGMQDLLNAEGAGVTESTVNINYLTFDPQLRQNAISLTSRVIKQLQSGPLNYNAVARALYHIAYDKRRKLDNLAYLEMIMASDEFAPNVIANESGVSGDYTAGSGNVTYQYSATLKGTAIATKGTNPIVRPRTKKQHKPDGTYQTVVTNPVTVKVGSATLVQGYLDANGTIQGGDYAVNYENGVFYFAGSAGLNPSAGTPILPQISYSGVTNYSRWSYTVPGGVKAEDYYNSLLQLFTTERGKMGSSPRFQAPNLGIMSYNLAAYIENASMWYKLNNPDIGKLYGLADSTLFGERSGIALARINAQTVFGDSRIILGQKGATRYAIESAYAIKGPFAKYDTNGLIIPGELYYGEELSVMATPQAVDSTGAIINPKYKTIKVTA